MSATSPGRPRGFALPTALFALVVIAALVTGGFFAARQELKVGQNTRSSLRAFTAAEAGLNGTIGLWNTVAWNGMTVGDSMAIPQVSLPGGGGSYSGWVRRLNDQLFVVRSTGLSSSGTGQRTLAALVRLQYVAMQFTAALTARGSLTIGGSSFIDGRDDTPSGWSCPGVAMDTMPGIVVPNSSLISYSGCADQACLAGDPKVQVDPTVNDSTFFKYGSLTWNDLVAMANVSVPSGNFRPQPIGSATTCTTSDNTNWGEPLKPPTVAGCKDYFPIIHVGGDLMLSQGRGQGILLVEGDIDVQGQFEFYGPVIVRGRLKTSGTGNHFYGGVQAANVDLENNSVLGNAVVTYSSCALATALKFNAPGRLVRERSWGEIFF